MTISRKQFIESHGATCDNWTWSWSFINNSEKFVIFGAWDVLDEGNRTQILCEDWEISRRGRRQSAYRQSREHIKLVEEEGYALKTFRIERADESGGDREAPAKIKGFQPDLADKELIRVGNSWYACDEGDSISFPDEVIVADLSDTDLREGRFKQVTVNQYERSAEARAKCLAFHGYACSVCDFDFEQFYGGIGRRYIHVHHVVPLSEIKGEYQVDPVRDLVPVCPNCHAMIHSTRPALTVDQLRHHLRK